MSKNDQKIVSINYKLNFLASLLQRKLATIVAAIPKYISSSPDKNDEPISPNVTRTDTCSTIHLIILNILKPYSFSSSAVKAKLHIDLLSNLFACFSKLFALPTRSTTLPKLILKLQNGQKNSVFFFKKLLHLGHFSCFKLFQFIGCFNCSVWARMGLRKSVYSSYFSLFSRLSLRERISSFVSPYPLCTHALAPEDGALFRPYDMLRHNTSEVDLILPLSTRERTPVLSEGCKEKYFDRRARISPNHNHQSILIGCLYRLSLDFSNNKTLPNLLFRV